MDISLQNGLTALDNRSMERAGRLAKEVGQKKDDKKLRDACSDFEGIFINMMLKEMRKTVSEGEFLGNSREEKLFREMLDEKLGEEMAREGRLGIGKMLYNQLKVKNPVKTSLVRGESNGSQNL